MQGREGTEVLERANRRAVGQGLATDEGRNARSHTAFVIRPNEASAQLQAIAAQRPGLAITHEVQPAAMQFPLISDAVFRQAFAFAPEYDLIGLVADMLATAG